MIRRSPRPKRAFTVVSNHVLEDARLSFKATGLLIYILSKPDNWHTSTQQLAKAKREGPDAVRTALSELERAGYVHRCRYQDKRGRWAYAITVFDHPQTGDNPVDNQGICPPPHRDFPHEENRHI